MIYTIFFVTEPRSRLTVCVAIYTLCDDRYELSGGKSYENKEDAALTGEQVGRRGRRAIVPDAPDAATSGVHFSERPGRSTDLLETHSSLVGKRHGAVQAVLTSEHAMSMKNLCSETGVSHSPIDDNFRSRSPPSSWRATRRRSPRFRWHQTASAVPLSRGDPSGPS